MSRIAIVSTEKLQFPPNYLGFVGMDIDLIQIKPQEEKFEIRVVDSCFDWVEETYQEPIVTPSETEGEKPKITYEEKRRTIKKVFSTQTRIYQTTNAEADELAKFLKLDRKKFATETEYLYELFLQSLFIKTQQECQQGIAGEGLGMYFSRANQWEIVREEGNN